MTKPATLTGVGAAGMGKPDAPDLQKSKAYAENKFGALRVVDGVPSEALFRAAQHRMEQFGAGVLRLKGESTAGLERFNDGDQSGEMA